MHHKLKLSAIAAWGAILFIPFLGASHLFDWDEINFAESAREMLLTGEYFRVQINFKPFWEKPPLFFWLQTLSYKTFGINEFAARFPNAICGILVLATVYHIGRTHFNSRIALLWVFFITGSFTPHLYYKSGIIDPWFNYFIFLSVYQLFLATINEEKRTKHFIYMGLFNGLAILTKGPVALLILGICGLVLLITRKFKPYFNVVQLLLAVIPIVAITSIWFLNEWIKNGSQVLVDFIAYQIDLFVNPVAGHGQPWFYHPILVFVGCFPASIFALKGFGLKSKDSTHDGLVFKHIMTILFWVVMILFSIVKTKIVHYSSLCYVPLTFLAAYYVHDVLKRGIKLPLFKPLLVLLIGGLISFAFMALPFIDGFKHQIIPYINDPFAVASLRVDGHWNGGEWIIGSLFGIMILAFFMQQHRMNIIAAIYSLLIAFSLLIPIYVWQVTPKIEQYSQAPAIEFYKSLQGKSCYVETLDFKSYAQYFYAQQEQHKNPLHTDGEWLQKGKTDKPVYFVGKITSAEKAKLLPFDEIGRKGGFIFYVKRNNEQHNKNDSLLLRTN